jgi:hypothetical protein
MTLRRKENIHFAEVGDEYYVLLEDADALACINAPAFVLMENCDGFTDPKDWCSAFAKASRLEAAKVRKAAEDVMKQMEKAGFLVKVKKPPEKKKKGPYNFDYVNALADVPRVERVWSARELAGGLFINSRADDIRVIVPNVTDGPIKTCPPHTCTIPAGLFTAETIIRTFNVDWRANFEQFRRSGFVHFNRRG